MKQIISYKAFIICFLLFAANNTHSLYPVPKPSDFSNRVMANYAGQLTSKATSSLIAIEAIEKLHKNNALITIQNGVAIGSLVGLIDYSIRRFANSMDWHSEVSFISVEIESILRTMLASYFSKYSNDHNIDPTLFLTLYNTADYLLSSFLYTLFLDRTFIPTLHYTIFNAVFAASLSVLSRINSYLFTHHPNIALFGCQFGIAYALGIAFIVAIHIARRAGAAVTITG